MGPRGGGVGLGRGMHWDSITQLNKSKTTWSRLGPSMPSQPGLGRPSGVDWSTKYHKTKGVGGWGGETLMFLTYHLHVSMPVAQGSSRVLTAAVHL